MDESLHHAVLRRKLGAQQEEDDYVPLKVSHHSPISKIFASHVTNNSRLSVLRV